MLRIRISDAPSPMTVALFGTFDVRNYGDALFPALVRRRLRLAGLLPHDDRLIPVSPLGGGPYTDGLPSVGIDEFLSSGTRVSAVLLGGGNILHASPLTAVYAGRGCLGAGAYPALWLAAETVARRDGAPLLWNAPGIPTALPPVAGRHLRRVAEASRSLSVRDAGSLEHLRATGLVDPERVAVVPDPAIELCRLFDRDTLANSFTRLCRRAGRSPDERWLVLHASPRRSEDAPAVLARHFDDLARRLDASPLLLDLGPCHRDGDLLRETARLMHTPPLLVDNPQRLADVTACLAHGAAYVGASMHGAIASASFSVPCVLVPPGRDHKHRDLMQRLGTPARLRPSWKNAVGWVTAAGLEAAPGSATVRRSLLENIDAHWERLTAALNAAPAERHSDTNASPTAPRRWAVDLLPPDLLLEQLDTATLSGLPRAPMVRSPNPRATPGQALRPAHRDDRGLTGGATR